MNILDAIQNRQSIRSFKNKEVPIEIIENILNISRFAPSGGNTQPWKIYVLNQDNMKKLEAEIESVTVTEKAYQEFDRMFSAVYPNFYKRLNKITRLSQTDIRLASYIKMNHSNNEISRISGISLRTVESQRYRLSKKLQLNKGQDLNQYIINI